MLIYEIKKRKKQEKKNSKTRQQFLACISQAQAEARLMSHMQSLSDHLLLAFAFSFIVTFLPLYYTVGPYSLLYNNRLMYILFHILFYNDIAVLLLLGVDHIFIVAYFIHRTIRWHLKDCNCSLRLSWYGHQVALDPAEPINFVNPSLKFLLLHCIWQRY